MMLCKCTYLKRNTNKHMPFQFTNFKTFSIHFVPNHNTTFIIVKKYIKTYNIFIYTAFQCWSSSSYLF